MTKKKPNPTPSPITFVGLDEDSQVLLIRGGQGRETSVNEIIKVVSLVTKVPVDMIYSSRRFREACDARRMAAAISRYSLGLTYAKLGKLFGNRDHSTMLANIGKHRDYMTIDPGYSRTYHECVEMVRLNPLITKGNEERVDRVLEENETLVAAVC